MATNGKRRRRSALLVAVAALLTGACSSVDVAGPGATPGPVEVQTVAALQPFDACDDVLAWVKEAAKARVTAWGLNGGGSYGVATQGGAVDTTTSNQAAGAPASPESFSAKSADASSAAPAHSDTNVQEVGVDEPDQVKTDGRRLLTLRPDGLAIVDVSGPRPTLAATLPLPTGTGTSSSLLLSGDRALVITPEGYSGGGRPVPMMEGDVGGGSYVGGPYRATTPGTWLRLVDIADATHPKIIDTVHLEGTYVDARSNGTGADARARLVVSSYPSSLPFVQPSGSSDASQQKALETNKAIIDASTIDDWVPHVRRGAPDPAGQSVGAREALLDCHNLRHAATFSGFSTLSLLTLDLQRSTFDLADGTGVLADGQTVYASTRNLYVATPITADQLNPVPPGTTLPPATVPATSPPAPTTTTPPGTTPGTTPGTSPESPSGSSSGAGPASSQAMPPASNEPGTAIHRFDISGTGAAQYTASGVVQGTVADQFSMSEQGDTLRVTTTRQWERVSEVVTLQATGNELRIVGRVGDIGRGEQVKAVRYVGDRGYVVTFRQTDPLFVIDLHDPTQPKITGELQMLGYSAYLHPIGDHLLLGIGQDASERGRTSGTKIALYDVSDPTAPRVVQDQVLSGASSPAEDDHHAFLWWSDANLAVLPVRQGWTGSGVPSCPVGATCGTTASGSGFDGALGLQVTANGIAEKGRIVSPWTAWPTGENGPGCPDTACAFPFTTPIDRLVVVGDQVLSVSSAGVLSSDLATLKPGPWLSLG